MANLARLIRRTLLRNRLPFVVAAHLLLIAGSNYIAFWLRFDGDIPFQSRRLMEQMIPVLVLIRAASFTIHRLYHGLWRYTGISDLWRIISATCIGTLAFYIVTHHLLDLKGYPRSVFVIDSILQIGFLSGIRLPWRIYREFKRPKTKGKRVAIYGAGDAGEMIVRDMKVHPEYNYLPVGFIDDDRTKVGQSIHGIPVLGTREALSRIIRERRVDEFIVAIPSAEPPILRDIVKKLELFNIPIKTTPNLRDILDGRVTVSQIRNLAVEDLLERVAIHLDMSPVEQMLKGKKVLVTGGGGSIGSELCRQVLKLEAQQLVLFERSENALFHILNELERAGYKDRVRPVVGDVTDRKRVNDVFTTYKPEIVLHAAAHKHVPLMEDNICEAIKNNVTGTKILAKAAIRNNVDKFVLISTDKAVNPTSIMGASKRVAELMTNHIAASVCTQFVAVRFGNVLASQGSVVPLFQEQIERGGPVTVTHPEMKRYFMLIPEAVQLVLLAGSIGEHATTYVLQMGDQIKVLDMARNLIRLSGFIPDVEIPIIFTGLRPGEKLFEELVGYDETSEPSQVPEILRIKRRDTIWTSEFREMVRKLERCSREGNPLAVVDSLKTIIPTFQMHEQATINQGVGSQVSITETSSEWPRISVE